MAICDLYMKGTRTSQVGEYWSILPKTDRRMKVRQKESSSGQASPVVQRQTHRRGLQTHRLSPPRLSLDDTRTKLQKDVALGLMRWQTSRVRVLVIRSWEE